jgi:hypothetical protein
MSSIETVMQYPIMLERYATCTPKQQVILLQVPQNRSRRGELSHQSPGHVNVFTAACALPAQSAGRGGPAMTQRPAKRLPTWLTIDLAVILVSLVIIGLGMWLAPW